MSNNTLSRPVVNTEIAIDPRDTASVYTALLANRQNRVAKKVYTAGLVIHFRETSEVHALDTVRAAAERGNADDAMHRAKVLPIVLQGIASDCDKADKVLAEQKPVLAFLEAQGTVPVPEMHKVPAAVRTSLKSLVNDIRWGKVSAEDIVKKSIEVYKTAAPAAAAAAAARS